MRKLFYIFLFLLIGIQVSYSQKVKTSVDSTKIRIGSQFHLTLKTKVDTASTVLFPKEKLFGALEVLEDYPTDTIIDKKDRAKFELIKRYGLTQFDSGRYVIPQLKILINNKPFLTDSLHIEVANIQVDTLKQPLYDIKDVIGASEGKSSFNWLLWLLIGVGVLGLIGLIFYFLKKRKNTAKDSESIYTPIEKATIGLKQLEEKQLIEKGEVKDYYSELTDITKTYLEEAVKFSAMENTTDELLDNLKKTAVRRKLAFSNEMIVALEKVLRQADLVKFAKSKPLDFEITNDRNTVEKTLRTMHGIIPLKTPEEEEAERNEELRLELERKRKKKKLIANISFAAGLLLVIGLAYWIATSGISTIKERFFAGETSRYLTSEWVTSEYGVPPVKIETPKVLKRMDINATFTDEQKHVMKEYQIFVDGELFKDNLFISLNTVKLNPEILQDGKIQEANVKRFLERNFAEWESNGAKNILTQQDEFKTLNGTEGIKLYGTFDYLDKDSKESKKIYYESLFFQHQTGFIHIIVHMNESDPNKNEIVDRIIKSVELGQAR